MHAADALLDYIQDLIAASRRSPRFTHGLSPRAGLALLSAARAWAFLSGRNMVLIAPQLALEAPDSSPGKLGMPDGLKNLLDEAAEKFAERTGSKRDEKAFRQAPVILSAFSGGYRSVAFSLARGGLGPRLKGVLLLDAIYGDVKLFSQWILQHWHGRIFRQLAWPLDRTLA